MELADFTDSLERIVLGAERRITISAAERERTAYHESGHAVLGMLSPAPIPCARCPSCPAGALGVTFQSPSADRYGDAEYLKGRIIGALGGRAAEELVYDDVTTGAESDLEQVTRIARQMVGRWGMSGASGSSPCCPAPRTSPPSSPRAAARRRPRELVDLEVRRIVEECYRAALGLLEANRERLESLAQTLLEHETLDEQDAYRAAGFPDARRARWSSRRRRTRGSCRRAGRRRRRRAPRGGTGRRRGRSGGGARSGRHHPPGLRLVLEEVPEDHVLGLVGVLRHARAAEELGAVGHAEREVVRAPLPACAAHVLQERSVLSSSPSSVVPIHTTRYSRARVL